jgi:hypothetical protein
MKKTTIEPIQPGNFTDATKEFGRDRDVHAVYSLKRGTLYNLHAQGKIRGVLLRVCGQKSGIRLWDMQSIGDYIRREMDASESKS